MARAQIGCLAYKFAATILSGKDSPMCCATDHGGNHHAIDAITYQEPYCSCKRNSCCGTATGVDGLCDRCREYCKEFNTDNVTAIIVPQEWELVPTPKDEVRIGKDTLFLIPVE